MRSRVPFGNLVTFISQYTVYKIQSCWNNNYSNSLDCALLWTVWTLTASISPASTLSPVLCKTSMRVFQETGCLPLPANHSSRIATVIFSASFACLCVRASTLSRVLSSRRRNPNAFQSLPISWLMLIFLFNPWNLMHSISVGWSWSPIDGTRSVHILIIHLKSIGGSEK